MVEFPPVYRPKPYNKPTAHLKSHLQVLLNDGAEIAKGKTLTIEKDAKLGLFAGGRYALTSNAVYPFQFGVSF